ncbi:MAG: hypothetical protein ABW068_15950 [Candidatus Thiodiazotropha sp.]
MSGQSLETWVWLALLAMMFNVAKALSVKTLCRDIEPSALVFYARLIPALALILPAYYSDYQINDVPLFYAACWHGVTVALLLYYLSRHYRTVLAEANHHCRLSLFSSCSPLPPLSCNNCRSRNPFPSTTALPT